MDINEISSVLFCTNIELATIEIRTYNKKDVGEDVLRDVLFHYKRILSKNELVWKYISNIYNGCIGCPWYDLELWKSKLIESTQK